MGTVLNAPMALVYESIADGRRSIAEMASSLAARTGLPVSEGIVRMALQELSGAGLLEAVEALGPRVSRRSLLRGAGLADSTMALLPALTSIPGFSRLPPMLADHLVWNDGAHRGRRLEPSDRTDPTLSSAPLRGRAAPDGRAGPGRKLLFRWSMWSATPASLFMLSHSIASFRAHFGDVADYVVFTDDPPRVRRALLTSAEVVDYEATGYAAFMDNRRTTWRKWAPCCRYRPGSYEFHVDADVFLLARPTELCEFVRRGDQRYIVVPERDGHYGNWCPLLTDLPFAINAGFLGQAPQADLSEQLIRANIIDSVLIPDDRATFCDEQGAVVYALRDELAAGQVHPLPTARYHLIGDFRDPGAPPLADLTLLHAACSPHHSFYQALSELSRRYELPAVPPAA
jgi:hypothetical protein